MRMVSPSVRSDENGRRSQCCPALNHPHACNIVCRQKTRAGQTAAGLLDTFRFVVISIEGWVNQQQQQAIDCLREENRVLREQLEAADFVSLMTSVVGWL